MTLKREVQNHEVNPKCGCVKCFIKSTMDENNLDYEDVINTLEALQELGMAIICKDANGEICEIIRAKSKKECKRMLAEMEG